MKICVNASPMCKSGRAYVSGKREMRRKEKKKRKMKEKSGVDIKESVKISEAEKNKAKEEAFGQKAEEGKAVCEKGRQIDSKTAFEEYLDIFRSELPLGECFDLLERKLIIGGRRASVFFVDGLHDSDKALELFKYLLAVPDEAMEGITSSREFLERNLPFMEAEVIEDETCTASGSKAEVGATCGGQSGSLCDRKSGSEAEAGASRPVACGLTRDDLGQTVAAASAADDGAAASASDSSGASSVPRSTVLPADSDSKSGQPLKQTESEQPAACGSPRAACGRTTDRKHSRSQLWQSCYAQYQKALPKLYAGLIPLIVEGLDSIIIMDARHYPARSVEEPEKEKTLRGAKDGFTETLMTNIGLIRRRIRSNELIFKAYNVGSVSKSDVALVYMKDRADMEFVRKLEAVFSEWAAEAQSIKPLRAVSAEAEAATETLSASERQRTVVQPAADIKSALAAASDRTERESAEKSAENSVRDVSLCGAVLDEQPKRLSSSPACHGKRGTQVQQCLSALLHRIGRFGFQRRPRTAEATDVALTASDQSLLEKLIRKFNAGSGMNPFPKVRYTQRPDVIAAHLSEGKVAVITDNSPTVMLIPTGVLEFFQDVDDYYFPQLTGNYFRFIKLLNFFVILFLNPVFFLMAEYDFAPEVLKFFVPAEEFAIPIFWQFILLEIAVDGLKLASLNTPSSLGASLSVIGALILGEFSIESGWFIPQTILCMAVVALAAFTQPSIEFSYAMKFCRVILLIGAYLFGLYGLAAAFLLVLIITATTKTLTGGSYLYPLIPFDAKILKRLIFRTQK